MTDLTLIQLSLVLLIFVWSGFVRTGLGLLKKIAQDHDYPQADSICIHMN